MRRDTPTRDRITRRRAWMAGAMVVAAAVAAAAAALTTLATDDLIRIGRRPTSGAPAVRIYPTSDRLPANLLRLYVVFDRPMRMGQSHAFLRLLDGQGRFVERAFLELDEELWDPTGRRLTVLFDPGRIKRGLRSNLEDGPPLVEGGRYRLVVGAGWRDAEGRPLGRALSKEFVATAPDRESPAVDSWRLSHPPAGSQAPLIVEFGEPLDRALVSSEIAVVDATGVAVAGHGDAVAEERGWRFTPRDAWRPNTYALRVSSQLEDVAGNNLQRVFDVDLRDAGTEHLVPLVVERRFRVTTGT